jgi:hypothetical protein
MIKNSLKNSLICLILSVITIISGTQLAQAQTDPKLLEKLIKVTSDGHPFRKDLKDLLTLPAPDPAKVAEKFDPALAENTQLTAEQKQFIKANYDKLGLIVNDKMVVVTGKHVKFGDWLTAYLTQTYPKELTPEEMQNWITFFEPSEGKLILKTIFTIPQPTDADSQALMQKFEKNPIGIKFISIFGDALNTYIQAKMGGVEATVKGEYEKLLLPAELNKMFNQFVAENFKKP